MLDFLRTESGNLFLLFFFFFASIGMDNWLYGARYEVKLRGDDVRDK